MSPSLVVRFQDSPSECANEGFFGSRLLIAALLAAVLAGQGFFFLTLTDTIFSLNTSYVAKGADRKQLERNMDWAMAMEGERRRSGRR